MIAIALALLWWLILRRPASALPPYLTRRWQDALPVEDRNPASVDAWEQRHRDAGHRRDQLALRALRAAGEATRARWLAHHAARARLARIPPTDWPRIAAGMAHAVEGAQKVIARRVVQIRRRA